MEAKDQVRLLISDVGGTNGTSFIFSDTEIEEFLVMRGGNVFRGAATALRTIAGNRVQVAQRINYLGLETHGNEEADALRELAKSLEDQADNGDGSGYEIEFADLVRSDFGGP